MVQVQQTNHQEKEEVTTLQSQSQLKNRNLNK